MAAAATPQSSLAEADALHGMLMRKADALAGCTEGSDEEAELEAIIDLIEAYKAKRWPLGKDPKTRKSRSTWSTGTRPVTSQLLGPLLRVHR